MTAVYQESKYEIETSDCRCHTCCREVACDAQYYSAVFFEGEQFRRKNHCLDCWSAGGEAASKAIYAFWRTRRPPLPTQKPRKMQFDTELVFEFFRRLGEDSAPSSPASPAPGQPPPAASGVEEAPASAEPSTPGQPPPAASRQPPAAFTADLRFVLALLLIRKKVLALVSTAEREGREWLKISAKREPKTTYWIKNPNLNATQLESVKVKIGELLQMQL